MSEYVAKCTVCGGLIFEEELFCSNCGTEAPHGDEQRRQDRTEVSRHSFVCEGCGASMSYDASAQTLRCPFCGSERLNSQPDTKTLSAEWLLPFAVNREQATELMRIWLGKGFWRPGDLRTVASITKITPVYVPYWVFQATTSTYWTADTNHTPAGARADWFPLFGEHHGRYDRLLVGASGVLTPAETAALWPFDLTRVLPAGDVDTENVIVEQFRVQRKYARPQARQLLDGLEAQACRAYVAGKERNMKVNVRVSGMASHPILLPVWVMAYRYQDRVYRFLLNGQNGRAIGQAPTSWKKVLGAVAIVVLAALLLFLGLFAVAAG